MYSLMSQVYHLLEDRESQEIFLNRILYNITKDKHYIDNINSTYIKRAMVAKWNPEEYRAEIQILRQHIKGRKIIIYGIGECGFATMLFFKALLKEVEIIGFCDRKSDTVDDFYGYKVISAENALKKYKDTIIVVTPAAPIVKEKIISDLVNMGFNESDILKGFPFTFKSTSAVLRLVCGEYFDKVLKLRGGEIFVDAGCLNCANTIDFIKKYPDYKEIIAFEPDPVSCSECQAIAEEQNIRDFKVYNVGLWDRKTELHFWSAENKGSSKVTDNGTTIVQADSLDHILQGKKVSFIKMDIEGAELKALHGCQSTLVNHKPRLAICVYHKSEDIIDIPLYLHSVVPEYKFYMRHYSFSKTTGTVLYAIAD